MKNNCTFFQAIGPTKIASLPITQLIKNSFENQSARSQWRKIAQMPKPRRNNSGTTRCSTSTWTVWELQGISEVSTINFHWHSCFHGWWFSFVLWKASNQVERWVAERIISRDDSILRWLILGKCTFTVIAILKLSKIFMVSRWNLNFNQQVFTPILSFLLSLAINTCC